MSMRVVAGLGAAVVLAALVGVPLGLPHPVLAATVTLGLDTALLDAPVPEATAVALLPAGTILSVANSPVAGYYPVTAGELTGWVPGEVLLLDDVAMGAPAAGDGGDPALTPTVGSAATPIPEAAKTDVPPEPSGEGKPVSHETQTPALIAEDGPYGPAGVLADAPILLGPGPTFGLIITAPAGSTVLQTGNLIAGYVTVQFAELTGWIALDHLGPPPAPVEIATADGAVDPAS